MKRKNKTEEYLRVEEMLQADKSVMSEGCKALVLQDFARLFDEYFELTGLPEMKISPSNTGYRVEIVFDAERIKKFNVLR